MIKEISKMLLALTQKPPHDLDADEILEAESLVIRHRQEVRQAWGFEISELIGRKIKSDLHPNSERPLVLEPGCGSGVLDKIPGLGINLVQLEPVAKIAPKKAITRTFQKYAGAVEARAKYDGVIFINLFDRDDSDIQGLMEAAAQVTKPGGTVLVIFDAMPYFPGLNSLVKEKVAGMPEPRYYLLRGDDERLKILACPKDLSPIIASKYGAYIPDRISEDQEFAYTLEQVKRISTITTSSHSLDYFQEFSDLAGVTVAMGMAFESEEGERLSSYTKIIDVYDLWAERIRSFTPDDLEFKGHEVCEKKVSNDAQGVPHGTKTTFKHGVLIRNANQTDEEVGKDIQEVAFHCLTFTKK